MILFATILIVTFFDSSQIGLAHWLVFILTWASVVVIATKISPDPFSPVWIFVAYLFACFFVRPLYLLFMNESGFLFSVSNIPIQANSLLSSNILLFVSFASFVLGYQSVGGGFRNLVYRVPSFSNSLDFTFLRIFAFLIILAAILSYVYVVQQLGGITRVLSEQASLVKVIPELGFGVKLAWVILNLYFLGTILFLIANGPSKGWIALVLFGLLLFLSIGRRSPILAMLMPLIIFRHYYVKRLTLRQAGIASGVAFLLLAGVAIFRILTAESKEVLSAIAIFDSAEYYIWDMNIATLESFGSVMPFRAGLDFLPYWLRSGLSIDWYGVSFESVGQLQVAIFFPEFPAGIPAGLQGTLFMNFGWFAVIVGMCMTGVVVRFFYEYTQLNLSSRLVTLLIYPVILLAFFYILRLGDFWLGFSTQIRFFAMAILLALISNHFRLVLKSRNV